MNDELMAYHPEDRKIYRLSLFFWSLALVSTGTYIRNRAADTTPDLDWLVLAQLIIYLSAGVLGIILIYKHAKFGIASKTWMTFIIASIMSSIFSAYQNIVLGYLILLIGISLLTYGLVQRSRTVKEICIVEKVWFIIIFVLLLKDTIISLLFPSMQQEYGVGGPTRLGMGVTHANAVGFSAALLFWLTFKDKEEAGKKFLFWIIRLILILLIVFSYSRTAMIGLIIGGLIRLFLKYNLRTLKGTYLQMVLVNFFLAFMVVVALAFSLEVEGTQDAFNIMNRGQDVESFKNLTSRTLIWPIAIEKIFANPISILLGYGYGVSRFIINEGFDILGFYAANVHNTFLEVLLSCGFFGGISFLVVIIVSLSWLFRFRSLSHAFSIGFTLRAATVITLLMINFLTESHFSAKIGGATVLFIFYVLALDREKDFIKHNGYFSQHSAKSPF